MQSISEMPPIDFAAALNEDQYRAVTAGNGPALVLAGAGSGKTRTLTYRVAFLLEQGIRPWEILLLTFTNKAAKEMLTRVEDLTGIPRTHFWGGTFHSIGARILRKNATAAKLNPNFTILDTSDAESLFSGIVKTNDTAFTKNKENPKPKVILDAISFSRNTRRPLAEIFKDRFQWLNDTALGKLPEFAALYREKKREQSVCDYDDLLEAWLELLQNDTDVRAFYQRRFRHILVDEFQDTNKLQSEIVDLLAHEHQLMAVGDDAQCIYTWRGAEFANVADFQKRHPGTTIHKIEINYRSTPQILDFANGILLHQDENDTFEKKLRAVKPGGARPCVVPTLDATEQALFVIKRIQGLLDDGRDLGDITVLYRAHFHAMELQMELTRRGVPFVITSGIRFFEQAHIRDLISHLRFVHNADDTVAFTRLMALLPKVGPRTAERILELAKKEAASRNISLLAALNLGKILEKIPELSRDDYRDLILTLQNMDEAMHGPDAKKNGTDLFSKNSGNDTEKNGTAENILIKTPAEIVQIAVDGWYGDFMRTIFENWRDRRDDLDSLIQFAAKYADMNELLAQLVLLNSETGDKSAEPEGDKLRLTTIHQAKGLEFPVVFIIGCAEELFPTRRAIENDDVSEERRLFYVAATRAMEELYCVYPKITATGGPPRLLEQSRFINEVPFDAYETLRISRLRG